MASDSTGNTAGSHLNLAAWEPIIGGTSINLRDYFVSEGILPTRESADRVLAEARRVLTECNPPALAMPPRTGLVCGYVQSGKTASMTAVSALAKDNGYRIVVLIAGVTTNLMRQNRDRLETHLRAAAPGWSWLMLDNPTLRENGPDLEALVREWRSTQYAEADRRTLFISVMKNHSHLQNLADLLLSINLSGVPAIVFDDEADQASLNTSPNDPVASSTYRRIESLRQTLPNHTYLQYTATPQAPLLITRIDALSADFAELLSPGDGYAGGEQFFGGSRPHVRIIPPHDVFSDKLLPLEPPESLLSAMQVFFVGVAAGRLVPSQSHRSMLLHPSKATVTHQRYYDWTNQLKADWHDVLLAESEPDRGELLGDFRRAYDDLACTCPSIPAFEEIQPKLPVAINQTSVTLVNSVDGREVPWQNGYSHILIGGEKLGRGYTVRGLTVTYMPRPAGGWMADTIQQRARFFGYHNDYLGYCRVYLHPDVRDIYIAYVNHEEDMRKRLAEHSGHPLHEWRRLFYLSPRLAPTRRNVLSSPWMRGDLNNGWFAPRSPQLSPEEGRHNAQVLAQLNALEFRPDPRYPRHRFAVVYLKDIFEPVLVPISYLHPADALGLCVANCNLKTLLENDEKAHCVIYRMDEGKTRRRDLTKGEIPQLFQGRSSKGSESYPGDRVFHRPDIPTLQIHSLELHEGNEVYENVPAVAIRLSQHEALIVHDE